MSDHGARRSSALPTAIATERYGLEEAQYRQFAETYGFDVRTWPGYPVLREIREVTMTTWIMQNVGESSTSTSRADKPAFLERSSPVEGAAP